MRSKAFLILLVVVCVPVSSLEVERGDIRLALHEDSSRFTLSIRSGEGWLPLLFAEDPRTSALEILEGNRVHRMGDSGSFSQRVRLDEPDAQGRTELRVHTRDHLRRLRCGRHDGRHHE